MGFRIICALLLLPVLLTASCTDAVVGRAVSVDRDPLSVGGIPAVSGPNGLRPLGPPLWTEARGSDAGTVDQLALAAVQDIETFWDTEYPKLFPGQFTHPRYLQSWDSRSTSAETFCGQKTAELVNAAYCIAANAVGWDRGALLPALIDRFGPMSVVMVLAHEFGHAVQRQSHIVDANTPGIVLEQQADCFGGAFIRHVTEGRAAHFTLNTADGLSSVLATIISVRDADSVDPEAIHGSGFERVSAVQLGFTEGPAACRRIDLQQIHSRRADLPQRHQHNPDNPKEQLPIDRANLTAFARSLHTLLPVDPAPRVSFDGTGTGCADTKLSSPVSYCPDTNTIGVDLPALAARGMPATDPDNGLPLTVTGDYTAFVEFGSRYVLAVQHAAGLPLTGPAAALRTACLSGAFTTGFSPANPDRVKHDNDLITTPQDNDKAISGLLSDGLAASDLNGTTIPSGFARIDAFRWGITHTQESCTARYR